MEVAAVLLFIFIPGLIIGGLLGFRISKGFGLVGRLISAILVGLLFAYVIVPGTLGTLAPPFFKIRDQYKAKRIQEEIEYFKKALWGSYSQSEVKKHYFNNPLSYEASFQLIGNGPEKLKSASTETPRKEEIALLADIFAKSPRVVKLLATLPNASLSLKSLAAEMPNENDDKYVMNYMANDSTTPPEVLIKLAAHSRMDTAKIVLINKNAPSVVRDIVAIRKTHSKNDTDVPSNETIPPTYFTKDEKAAWDYFANHQNPEVVIYIARHQAVPRRVLENIAANNSNEKVNAVVFLNNKTTQQTKKSILQHFPALINYLLSESTNSQSKIKMEIASSSESTPQMLDNLVRYGYDSHLVFVEIAKNSHVTPNILSRLADTSYSDVRKLVAQNPLTPRIVLEKLSNDQDPEISKVSKLNIAGITAVNQKLKTNVTSPTKR